ETIQIAIVVKNDLLRSGLKTLLNRPNHNIHLHGVYAVLNEYERSNQHCSQQQLLILDDSCTMKPFQTIEKLVHHFPQLKIIILSHILSEKYIQQILDAGAYGFFYTQDRFEENLLIGIRNVIAGEPYLSPKVALLPYAQANEVLNLTDHAVLELMALGYTT